MLIGHIRISLITVVMTVFHIDRGAGLYFIMMLMLITCFSKVIHYVGMTHRVGVFAGASGISVVVPAGN